MDNVDQLKWIISEVGMVKEVKLDRYQMEIVSTSGGYSGSVIEANTLGEAIEAMILRRGRQPIVEGLLRKMNVGEVPDYRLYGKASSKVV